MVQVHSIVNLPVSSMTYIIEETNSHHSIIVDPGTKDCHNLNELIKSKKLIVDYVILTHEHIDHTIGLTNLKCNNKYYIICSERCNSLIRNTKHNLTRLTEQFEEFSDFPMADITFEGKLNIMWQGDLLTIYEGKGHSQGSIYFVYDNLLFIGDILIPNYTTVTTLPGGNKKELLDTFIKLQQLIDNVKTELIVYPGHFTSVSSKDFIKELSSKIEAMQVKLNKKRQNDAVS